MKLKALCSAVVLCFVANVFAMDSDSQKDPTLNSEKFGQSTSADQSNLENLSKEELLKVTANLQQQIAKKPNSSSFEKLEDPKPIYNEALESARQELKSAQQDVKNFQELYEKALGELKNVDSRAQIITKRYGEAECLKRGIPQDKAKAEQDVKNYLELLWDARDRKNKAHSRINKLTKELGISSQAKHNDIQSSTDNGKSPLVALYEFCRSKDTPYSLDDLKFDYVINKGKFNCILGIGGKKFSQDTFYESKKEAKNAIAKYALNVLKQKGFATDNKNPVVKLNEYLHDKRTKYNLSDVDYIYDLNNDGTFNCIIRLRINKEGEKKKYIEFDQDLHCKSKKEAKNTIAGYVYNALEAGAETLPQASSSGTNQQQITEEPHSSSFEKLEDLVKSKPNLSVDYNYIYDRNKGSKFIITVKKNGEKDRKFDQDRFYKHHKDARNAIAEYVYNVLKKEEANAGTLPQASSSGLISNLRL